VGFGGAAAIAFVTDDARNMNENYSFPASFCPPPLLGFTSLSKPQFINKTEKGIEASTSGGWSHY
jgi:hypothetical protein